MTQLTGLTSLDIDGNNIGPQGAASVAQLTNLTSLNISMNNIGSVGTQSLKSLKKIKELVNYC